MKQKVQDFPGLVRDSRSKAIVNEDVEAYNKYKKEKEFRTKMLMMEQEVSNLKDNVDEIKGMLKHLISISNNSINN